MKKAKSNVREFVGYLYNHYHPRMMIGCSFMYLIYLSKRLSVRDYVVVSPARPHHFYSLWKLSMLSGIRMVSEDSALKLPKERQLARIRHHDDTWDDQVYAGYLNGSCTDISKSRVDEAIGQAFGYTTRIDPTSFEGQAVKKSEENYSGGGVFIECPIKESEIQPGYIYQKLVDNKVDGDTVKEFRVSVICGEIVDVIVQYRSVERRLTGRGSGGGRGSMTCRPEEVFSAAEITQIGEFCRLLGFDYGELDVLPDVDDGLIYVLDANKTPTYMSQASAFRVDRFKTVWHRAKSFKKLLEKHRSSEERNVRFFLSLQ